MVPNPDQYRIGDLETTLDLLEQDGYIEYDELGDNEYGITPTEKEHRPLVTDSIDLSSYHIEHRDDYFLVLREPSGLGMVRTR